VAEPASLAAEERFLAKADFQALIDLLAQEGYQVIGPTLGEGAIVYGPIRSAADLPRGWTDDQEAGHYRLVRREDDAWFGFVVGPHSWKQFLFPPNTLLHTATREQGQWRMDVEAEAAPRYAFLGVRACELAALDVQDRVFLGPLYQDPHYARRRQQALVIAVNCTQAARTCFCTSMGTGPRCHHGFDLALTELPDGFLLEVGSQRGAELAARLPLAPATAAQHANAAAARAVAERQITRRMQTQGLRELLLSNLNHPHWDAVAARCLSCTNCTMVCPTCFCSSVQEVSDLTLDRVERHRVWDSCFNPQFSYVHGGLVRHNIRSRYRQWLTHKLATWHDQFGTSGCVGCGRCISWCPVGIDLTQEVAAFRGTAERAAFDRRPGAAGPAAPAGQGRGPSGQSASRPFVQPEPGEHGAAGSERAEAAAPPAAAPQPVTGVPPAEADLRADTVSRADILGSTPPPRSPRPDEEGGA
jgi:ferredoxin